MNYDSRYVTNLLKEIAGEVGLGHREGGTTGTNPNGLGIGNDCSTARGTGSPGRDEAFQVKGGHSVHKSVFNDE